MATRCEPNPIPIPAAWAASANRRLIALASGVPPVIEEMRSGAANRLPSSVVEVSTSSRLKPGNAQWAKR